MKVLFLSHNFYPFVGGIESVSLSLANSFKAGGYDVHLMTWSEDPTNMNFPFKVIRKPNIVTIINEHHWADLVFENNICLRLSWPSLFFKQTKVISLHTWLKEDVNGLNLVNKLKKSWLKRANVVVACSNAIKLGCWPESKVVENPYNDELFVRTQDKKMFGFVFLGRLVSDKGADLAIQAVKYIAEIRPEIETTLSIIGDGPERTRLESLAFSSGLQEKINFLGNLTGNDLVTSLNNHKYIIVPSIWEEPFGIVAIEGMACGCVPIVAKVGGLPEAIGNAGLTFSKGSIIELSERMCQLLDDTSLEAKLRNAAIPHLEKYKVQNVASKYLGVLNSVVVNAANRAI